MKKLNILLAYLFISTSIISLLYTSIIAWINPQTIMDFVKTDLPNTDALSSIRGIYGGAGLSFVVILIYGMRKNISKTLLFLSLFWSLYAFARITTIVTDGLLQEFGNTWLIIESSFAFIAFLLFLTTKEKQR